jgi:hypothetical protein
MIGNGARAGLGTMLVLAVCCGPAAAQNKELSDKSVLTLMQYAWSLVPNKFTSPDGKVIEVDKSKPSEVVVPMETAREAIKVARLSAYAQVCDLIEEQRANYHTFMKREEAKAKWTDQQLLFINQLHLFTVMTLTGKVKLVEKDGDKEVILNSDKPEKAPTCTDTERKKVESQIKSYVAANMAPAPAAPAAAAAPAAPAPPAAPTPVRPASQKK